MECRYKAENLLAYVDNELSPEATQEMKSHICNCAICRNEVDELRNVTSLLGMLPDIEFSEDVRLRLSEKLKESILEEETANAPAPFWKMWKVLVPALASMACLILIYTSSLQKTNTSQGSAINTVKMASIATLNMKNNLNVLVNGKKIDFDADTSMISLREEDILTVAQGGSALITYPGDINIEVAPGSKLKIYDRWLHLNRGSGHFKLAKQHTGFQVTTDTVTITVVGTTFDVGVITDGSSKVALYEGSVSFETKKGKQLMKPGQTLTTSADGGFVLGTTTDNVDREIIFNEGRTAKDN